MSIGVPELIILFILFVVLAAFIGGIVLLLRSLRGRSAMNRRVETLEREVKTLRDQSPPPGNVP